MQFPLAMRDAVMPEVLDGDGAVSLMGEEEFRAFYERTARPLWAYITRVTGDRDRAEDLLQETYYRFYRAGERYQNEAHRRNSLFQIATNIIRDGARRAKHRQMVPFEDDSSGRAAISTRPVPEREAEIRTDLGRALARLEPLHRELLWLAYAQGASHEEIATIVGVRAVSVRTLLLRARKRLARLLTAGATPSKEELR